MVFLAKTKGNKYTRLMVNTVIFGIGQFSSKILVFIMLPIYTGYLTTAEYGTVDLIQQSANVLWPVITVGITNGIIRFGLTFCFPFPALLVLFKDAKLFLELSFLLLQKS